ncbi:MAG TPA: hypothetical protein PKG95_01450 [Anaerolineaceae bacterium]|nr:hypothetical protein [Anaerolineaceae bacterium]
MKSNLVFLVVMICLLMLACAPLSLLENPTPVPILPATATSSPTLMLPESSPTPTASPIPTGQPLPPSDELSPSGPWLIFQTEDGLWTVNADGGGLTQVFYYPVMAWSVSPRGREVMIISASEPYLYQGLTLWRLSFPGAQLVAVTALTNDETEPSADMGAGDPAMEAARAMVEQPNLAWSPDGQTLAFIGAMDGPTADLYTYSLLTGKISRLTDGPSQAYNPIWSPGGTAIAHLGVNTFGTGAGYDMAGGWVVRVADGEVFTLYNLPEDSASEEILAWLDEQTLLLSSWDPICGPKNVRTYNYKTQATREHVPGYVYEPLAAPNGNLLYQYPADYQTFCGVTNPPGIYVLPIDDDHPTLAVPEGQGTAIWEPALSAFLVQTDAGLIKIQPNTAQQTLPAPSRDSFPILSPNIQHWAWADTGGVWVGAYPTTSQQIFTLPAQHLVWSWRSDAVLFFTEDDTETTLYRAEGPEFGPVRVLNVPAPVGSPLWIVP